MSKLRRNLRSLFLAACAVLPSACRPGAVETGASRSVIQVAYDESSGPLPDPWSERYTITEHGVELRRTGVAGGPVSTGTWKLESDRERIARLFAQLAAVDCSSIHEIAPEELLDGGGSTSFEVRYSDGSTCGVWYREGYAYAGAEPLVTPISAFIAALSLPAGAADRFRTP